MASCNIEKNKQACNCTYPCDKKGLCCACIRYHRQRNELPACYFPNMVEQTYDRSIENYIRTCQNR